ncbi:MAG: recombinase family protein [Nitrosospira sp.]
MGLVSLTEALDMTTPSGCALAGMLSVFAAFERNILRDRVRVSIAAARKAGKAHGRPITIQKYLPEIRRPDAAGASKRKIAKRLKIARTSVRRLLEASRTRRRPVLARPWKAA